MGACDVAGESPGFKLFRWLQLWKNCEVVLVSLGFNPHSAFFFFFKCTVIISLSFSCFNCKKRCYSCPLSLIVDIKHEAL